MNTFVFDARTANNHFPGIGRYVSNLAHALVPLLANDERMIMLTGRAQLSRWTLPEGEAHAQGQVQHVEVAATPFSAKQQWVIPSLLKRLKASLYHSPYYLMPYWPATPAVLTFYDLIPQLYPEYVSFQARLLFQVTTAMALRSAERIITISEATKRDLFARYPGIDRERVQSIPLAPDPIFRPVSPEQIEVVRAQHHLPEAYVLYVGSNKPHKNLARLLDAWQIVIRSLNTKPCLVVAGAWDERYSEPLQRAESHGLSAHVRFLGPVKDDELPALYSGATVFVFPSIYEGFGLPVIEAMACRTAVTCANTSSLPEIAEDAALLFDPAHVEDIAEKIMILLRNADRRYELQERGAKRAVQFSWERTASETLACYRQLLLTRD